MVQLDLTLLELEMVVAGFRDSQQNLIFTYGLDEVISFRDKVDRIVEQYKYDLDKKQKLLDTYLMT